MTVLGTRVPSTGTLTVEPGLGPIAAAAEQLGVESLWMGDHLTISRKTESRYPFSEDGKMYWEPEMPWYETLTCCAWAAASAPRVRVGPGVMVLPQRDPLLVAKTAASIDALSGGRLLLGVGVGWYREEFEALGWEFETRGRRMEEAIALMRACWSGAPDAFNGEFFQLPAEMLFHPRPTNGEVPILIGGMSPRAIDRAARIGDGWLALSHLDQVDPARLGEQLQRALEGRAPDAGEFLTVVRLVGDIDPEEAKRNAEAVHELARHGFDEVAVDLPLPDVEAAREVYEILAAAVA